MRPPRFSRRIAAVTCSTRLGACPVQAQSTCGGTPTTAPTSLCATTPTAPSCRAFPPWWTTERRRHRWACGGWEVDWAGKWIGSCGLSRLRDSPIRQCKEPGEQQTCFCWHSVPPTPCVCVGNTPAVLPRPAAQGRQRRRCARQRQAAAGRRAAGPAGRLPAAVPGWRLRPAHGPRETALLGLAACAEACQLGLHRRRQQGSRCSLELQRSLVLQRSSVLRSARGGHLPAGLGESAPRCSPLWSPRSVHHTPPASRSAWPASWRPQVFKKLQPGLNISRLAEADFLNFVRLSTYCTRYVRLREVGRRRPVLALPLLNAPIGVGGAAAAGCGLPSVHAASMLDLLNDRCIVAHYAGGAGCRPAGCPIGHHEVARSPINSV